MTGPALEPQEARPIVEARLGREPQDMLEVAVVLEAWAGVPAGEALDAGAAAHAVLSAPPRSRARAGCRHRRARPASRFEALAFVAAVVAMACWAGPLAAEPGRTDGPERADRGAAAHALAAVVPAQPLPGAPAWARQPRAMPWVLAGVAVALVGLPSAALGADGAVAALLTLTWTAGTILIGRRWSAAYAAAVGLATVAMLEGLLPLAVLAVVATATTAAAVVAAVRAAARRRVTEARYPGRWGRALTAGTIGAGLGVLLVADSGVTWTMGPVPALALLPSTVASFWGGYHLWQFQQAVPRSLRGIAVTQRTARGLAWPRLRILVGAVARLVCAAAALSAALVLAASCLGWTVAGLGVLFGFGLIALATLLVSLLESVGRAGWALLAVAAGISAEVAFGALVDAPFAGAGLVLGAAVAVVVVLPPSVALLTRPATTLATSLWIT